MRTDVIEGNTEDLPAEGTCFGMTAAPLDPEGSMRLMWTSPVTYVGTDGLFTTESGSCYRCEVLPDE